MRLPFERMAPGELRPKRTVDTFQKRAPLVRGCLRKLAVKACQEPLNARVHGSQGMQRGLPAYSKSISYSRELMAAVQSW